jgi:hypothetical protein
MMGKNYEAVSIRSMNDEHWEAEDTYVHDNEHL